MRTFFVLSVVEIILKKKENKPVRMGPTENGNDSTY